MAVSDITIRLGAQLSPEGKAEFKKISARLKNMGKQAAKAVSRAATGAGVASGAAILKGLSDYKDFSKAMAEVSTLINDQNISIEQLKSEILSVSKDTGQDPLGLAKSLYDTISAGKEAGKAVKFVATTTKAAIAGVAETADTVNLFTNILNNYRDDAIDVTKVSDVMFQTIKLGKTTMPELAENLGQVLPFASKLNVSIEEIGGAMATLTKSTGDTVMSSTWLKNILAGVLKPSKEMKEAVQAIGYESATSALKADGLNVFLDKLYKHVNGNEEALGKLFPSIRSLSGVLSLTGDNAKEFQENTDKMNHSLGSTETALKKIKLDKSFEFDKSINELKVFAMEISKDLLPSLVELTKTAAAFVKEHPELTKAFMGLTMAAAALNLSGLAPVLGSFGKIVLQAPKVIKSLKSIQAVQALSMYAGGGKFAAGKFLRGKVLSGGVAALSAQAALVAGTAYLGYKGGEIISNAIGTTDAWSNYYSQKQQIQSNNEEVDRFYSSKAQDRLTRVRERIHNSNYKSKGKEMGAMIKQSQDKAVNEYDASIKQELAANAGEARQSQMTGDA